MQCGSTTAPPSGAPAKSTRSASRSPAPPSTPSADRVPGDKRAPGAVENYCPTWDARQSTEWSNLSNSYPAGRPPSPQIEIRPASTSKMAFRKFTTRVFKTLRIQLARRYDDTTDWNIKKAMKLNYMNWLPEVCFWNPSRRAFILDKTKPYVIGFALFLYILSIII
jgi:hypothetical protein